MQASNRRPVTIEPVPSFLTVAEIFGSMSLRLCGHKGQSNAVRFIRLHHTGSNEVPEAFEAGFLAMVENATKSSTVVESSDLLSTRARKRVERDEELGFSLGR
jgi:hypothetical protein